MSINMTPQELYDSNDKVASIGIIAGLVGTFVGLIIFSLIIVWLFKFVTNNVFGCHFDPIHVELLNIMRENTPFALYRRARIYLKERRERRERNKNDLERGRSRSSRSTEPSMFTLAYASDAEKEYYSANQPSSSFAQKHPAIAMPEPALAQHNEAWWRDVMGSEDMATVIRSLQQTAYSRRASNA